MKGSCHTGNPLVFEAQGVKVYAGGNTRNGGWMQMNPKPDLAIGPQGVIRTSRTMDSFPLGWLCGSKVDTKKTPLLIELEWPDYSIPTNVGRDFWVQLVDDIKTNGIKSVSTQCMGGHGRTGVQLCILAHMMIPQEQHTWKDAGELIQYIRDVYCDHAVEAPSQQKYIADVLEMAEGENKMALVTSNNMGGIWDNVDYTFDADEVVFEGDEKRKKKSKKKGKSGAKNYTSIKRLPADTGKIRGHLLYCCEQCGDYEFRSTLVSNGEIDCEVCYAPMSFQLGEDSLSLQGDFSCSCDSCHRNDYHPLEMYDRRTCKICWLDVNDRESLFIDDINSWEDRKFKCVVSNRKHPIAFSVIENGKMIAANKSDDYKNGDGDVKTKTKTKKKSTLDDFTSIDDVERVIKTDDVKVLMEEYMKAEEARDKELMNIISDRIDEIYG